MKEGILSIIGNTPLVKLTRIFEDLPFNLYAKLEGFNPGGSIKDRAAHNIILRALQRGYLKPGATVIESSSGNMGIGLAQVCGFYGLRFICVVDPKTTKQNLEILRAYGAHIEMVNSPDPQTGEYLHSRIDRVQTLVRSIENSFWPDQYANRDNSEAHHQTMYEITTELEGRVNYLFSSTSTCGTLRGCAEYVKQYYMDTRIIAVDAIGSVIFGGQSCKRLIPGHGAAVRPKLHTPDLAHQCVQVSDIECVIGCRRLLKKEAILAGGSSGAVISALDRVKGTITKGTNCVLILPDRGERYLDTIYSDSWVNEHLGEMPNL